MSQLRYRLASIQRRLADRARGQSMVEFALILPLLLLLLFGIVELGRLLAIYSSMQAASREAARYASAAGDADPGTLGLQPYYLDTVGIRNAAVRLAVLSGIKTVDIKYDHGPATPQTYFTPGSAGDVKLGDRVIVTVSVDYNPLLGLTPLRPFTITSSTTRTIVKEVAVGEGTGSGSSGGSGGAPKVKIISPLENPSPPYFENTWIDFLGQATDADGNDISSLIQWSTNTVPLLFTGPSKSLQLNPGNPPSYVVIVTAQVTDPSSGEVGAASVVIKVYQSVPPDVKIFTPNSGAKFQAGQTVTFTGQATDVLGNDITSQMVWKANVGGVLKTICTGSPCSTSTLAVGSYTVYAEATANGQTGKSAPVTFSVITNEPPTLSILTPSNNAYYSDNSASIYFTGQAQDSLDGDRSAYIDWYFGNTKLGTGASLSVATSIFLANRSGQQDVPVTVTAKVSDKNGNVTTASVTFTIANKANPPTIVINLPANGTSVKYGTSIDFVGTASEKNTDISSSIQWYSTVDGFLGQGKAISKILSPGVHTITAKVSGNTNPPLSSTAIIGVTVIANNPPVVTIISPIDLSSFDSGDSIIFAGTATDVEDGSLSSKLKWYVDGALLGSGTSIITNTLTVGSHTILAQVFDSVGLAGNAQVTIAVKQSAICPTGGTLSFVCNGNTCNKLAWQFSTSGTSVFNVETIVVSWENTTFSPALGSISFGGGDPDPIPLGSNTNSTPVALSGAPLWSGAFNPDLNGLYSRTLYITFASPVPTKGLTGDFTVLVRFANCATSQATTSIPAP